MSRDKSMDWPLGGLCHDTVYCIVTSGQSGCRRVKIQSSVLWQGDKEGWPLAVSQYNTARAAIRPVHACDTATTRPGTGATQPRGEP